MKTIEPSNKRIIVALVVPLVVVGVFLLANTQFDSTEVADVGETLTVQGEVYEFRKDSDKDGLLDWEENLWGTDINNKDTDNDGFLDGEEVRGDRSPLIARPADLLTEREKAEVYTADAENFAEINRTEQISQILAPSVLLITAERLEGKDVPRETMESIAESALQSVEAPPATLYSVEDLTVINSTSDEDIANYIIGLLEAVAEVEIEENIEDELLVLAVALENKDPLYLDLLERNIDFYKQLQKNLLSLEVPVSMATKHLSIINNYQLIVDAVDNMKTIFEDPFTGLVAMESYRVTNSSNNALFKTMGLTLNTLIQ